MDPLEIDYSKIDKLKIINDLLMLMRRADLSANERILAVALWKFIDVDGIVRVTFDELSYETGLAQFQVKRYLNALKREKKIEFIKHSLRSDAINEYKFTIYIDSSKKESKKVVKFSDILLKKKKI